MKKLITIFTFILSIGTEAQNLVPNPSFEDVNMDCIPDGYPLFFTNGLIDCADDWFTPRGVGSSSSDLYFLSADNAVPEWIKSGEVSSRFAVFNPWCLENTPSDLDVDREYIEVELTETLQAGETYVVSMYVFNKLCAPMHNGIGAYFSEDSILYSNVDFMQVPWDFSLSPLSPQVDLKENELMQPNQWNHFYQTFVATGGEKFMTIGNFLADDEVTYISDPVDCWGANSLYIGGKDVQIDDVAVFLLSSFQDIAYAGNDTTICVGEMVSMGSHNYLDYTYTWLDENGNTYDGAYLDVSPTQTSSYVLTVKDNFFIETFDTLTVYVDDCIEYSANAGADTILCVGESLFLDDVYYSNYTYTWTDDFGGLWTGSSLEITPTETSQYYLDVSDDLGTTYDTVLVSVQDCEESIHEFNHLKVKIHPNPVSSIVQIESPYFISSWKLLDALGKEVASSKYMESSTNLIIDVSSFDAGLYFLEVEVEGVQVVKQLVIE